MHVDARSGSNSSFSRKSGKSVRNVVTFERKCIPHRGNIEVAGLAEKCHPCVLQMALCCMRKSRNEVRENSKMENVHPWETIKKILFQEFFL
jgi:hypothetical protein